MIHERWGSTEATRAHRTTLPHHRRWRSPWPRRLLLVILVAIAYSLTGCAYRTTVGAAGSGSVRIDWVFHQEFADERCGEAIRIGPGYYILRFKGAPPTFSSRLECLGHELLHAMGASHE